MDAAFVRASTVEAKPVDWLIEGVIPAGMMVDVAGKPGAGKSTWECWLTAEVTRSLAAPVILSNQEDPVEQVLVPRLEAAGAIMKRVHLADQPIRIPEHIGQLEQKIRQTGARLVILDAASQHLSVSTGNGQQIRQATTPLAKMLQRTGASVVFIDHVKKGASAGGHPLEALLGASSGLPAACRLVYVFGPSKRNPDELLLATAKSNIGPPRTLAFELMEQELVLNPRRREAGQRLFTTIGRMILLDDQHKGTAHDVIGYNGSAAGATGNGAAATAKAIAKEWLIAVLMSGPRKVADLQAEAAESQISWATIRRASDELAGLVKSRHGYGKGGHWEWALPDDHPAVKLAQRALPATA